jgi:hypothetical protein
VKVADDEAVFDNGVTISGLAVELAELVADLRSYAVNARIARESRPVPSWPALLVYWYWKGSRCERQPAGRRRPGPRLSWPT